MLFTTIYITSIMLAHAQFGQKINLDETDSLKSIFQKINATQSKTELRVSNSITNQRVTLCVKSESIELVREILMHTLNHGEKEPIFEWTSSKEGTKTVFVLKKTPRYARVEREELDFPKKQMLRILKSTRDYVKLDEEIRPSEAYSIRKEDMLGKVLGGLSDTQLRELVDSGSVGISNVVKKEEVENYNRAWNDIYSQGRENTLAAGRPDPYPNGLPNTGPFKTPVLKLGSSGKLGILFTLGIKGAMSAYAPLQPGIVPGENTHIIDPRKFSNRLPLPDGLVVPESIKALPEDLIDLTKYMADKEASVRMTKDLGYLLQVISKETKYQICEEHFLKEYSGFSRLSFNFRKGTLRQLFTDIWKKWGYIAELSDNTLYLWSNTWAFDRRADISDASLNYWRRRLKGTGLTVEDWMSIALNFNDYQIHQTLIPQLQMSPMDASNAQPVCLAALRFLGKIPNSSEVIAQNRTIPWQTIPMDLRSSLDFSTMQQLDLEAPYQGVTPGDIWNATGGVTVSSQNRSGYAVKSFSLVVTGQDKTNLFSATVVTTKKL